jgi:ParB family transcriptional regulator, chromosome partitioning protein
MKLPDGKSRLDMVREGGVEGGVAKRGRLVVSVTKLMEDPRNERKTFRNMDGLIASIKAVGVVEPITVAPETDGSFRIITGHRRYRAAREAGLDQVEVLIRDPEDERRRRLKSIVSNVQHEDVGPVELGEALQALMDEDDEIKTQEDLAKVIGKDKTWVSGMMRILTLPPALQQKVGLTQLSVPYDAMIRIARLDNVTEQERLVEAILNGASQRVIREEIDQIKGQTSKAKAKRKPKQVYRTEQDAIVIVQSTNSKLTRERIIGSLEEALKQARKS